MLGFLTPAKVSRYFKMFLLDGGTGAERLILSL
jgi:hypothetical protein